MRLEGKVALITGGARSQGATEARLFAKEGAKVVFGDVLEEEGRKVEAEINEAGGDAVFIRLDVTREEDWRRAIETTVSRYGKLNVLVNNAGISGPQTRLEEYTLEQWDQVQDVDLKGAFLGIKYAVPEMRKVGGGSIINISSVAALAGGGGSASYSAAKGGIRSLSKAVTVEYGHEGIRANNILPGPIDTVQMRSVVGDFLPQLEREVPIKRIGQTTEIAYGALFLASDESSYVAGTDLVIDGGWSAQLGGASAH
jgi:NAD(P)-dependent dehydrogenase (short-subunit alcohol dehydrogenase family)